MTRLVVLFCFFIPMTLSVKSQTNWRGKWYMFSRNWVIELTISKDSLVSRQLNWDLTGRSFRSFQSKPDIQLINKVVEANENIYLYLRTPRDTSKQIVLNTIKIMQPNKILILAINAPDSPFTDTTLTRQYISGDTGKKYGLTFYSEGEIHRLQQQKSIDKMTTEDFKLYANKFLHFQTEMDSLFKVQNAPNGLVYYGYSMIRNIIGQVGYNPLVTNEEFDEFIKRFRNDPETKEICRKVF